MTGDDSLRRAGSSFSPGARPAEAGHERVCRRKDASSSRTAPAVDTKATPDQRKADTEPVVKADRKKHHESIEARVIYELHRHGIYW